jgi:hypothetical protein
LRYQCEIWYMYSYEYLIQYSVKVDHVHRLYAESI